MDEKSDRRLRMGLVILPFPDKDLPMLAISKIYATHLFIPTEFGSGYVGPSMGQSNIIEI